MRSRRAVLGWVFVLIGLPVAGIPVEAARYFIANRDTESIVSSGIERGYVLHVPASYDGATPTPLVISLHGAGLWGAAHRRISEWDDVASREGFLVAYPSAYTTRGPPVWEVTPGSDFAFDVLFISDLIDSLSAEYNVDPNRIYANGFSAGGAMTFVLSCMLSRRFAAVGMVGAARVLPWEWCSDDRPLPMIAFHGTADRMIKYTGGATTLFPEPFPNVPARIADWAERNRCLAGPIDSLIAPDVRRRSYAGCADDADVVLYSVIGAGHTWPGGGPQPQWALGHTSHNIDASAEMWRFFRDHPLQRTPSRSSRN